MGANRAGQNRKQRIKRDINNWEKRKQCHRKIRQHFEQIVDKLYLVKHEAPMLDVYYKKWQPDSIEVVLPKPMTYRESVPYARKHYDLVSVIYVDQDNMCWREPHEGCLEIKFDKPTGIFHACMYAEDKDFYDSLNKRL